MTPEEQQLLAVARAISERSPVDWAETESSAADGSLKGTLRELRVIAEIAALHGSDRQPDIAERWGPLTLLEHVGHGSFGDVYRALDTRLDREVALKLMRRAETESDPLGTTVIDEARLLARVRHPNVVTIYGADRIEGRVGLWMEFVRGRTLEELLQARGPLPSDEVTTIGRNIFHALAAVHEAGLLHRDIKAQNVVQEPGGRLVLMDFGAGREAGDGDEETLAGTPLYLAPEVLEGRPASVRSDIYSVGVLLYHLSTGAYPVAGRTVREIRDAHRGGTRAALSPEVSPALAAVVRRALDPDPANRYALAADVAAALEAPDAAAQGHRWRPPALAAALVAIVLTAFAAWLLGTRNFSPSSERVLEEGEGTYAAASWLAGQDRRAIPGLRLVGYGDEGGSIDSSGRFMALTDRSGFDPYYLVFRDMTMTTRQDTRLASGDRGTTFFSALSSDARKVAYSRRTPEGRAQLLVSATAQDSKPVIVVDDAGYLDITPAAWSEDDRKILATVEQPDNSTELVLITEADGYVRVLKSLGWRLRGVKGRPALSPDGRYVAYSALATEPTSASEPLDSTDQHIYILATDGSGREREVVQGNNINESPIWTPHDGSHVLFMSNLSGTWDLRMLPIRNGEADGTPTEIWRDLGCCNSLHGISPAGRLYYTKKPPVEERTEIVEMESPGAKVKGSHAVIRILDGTLPEWSPDGRSIATKVKAPGEGRVRGVASSDFETMVYSRDGGEPKLYSRPARRNQVVWMKDSTGFLEVVRDKRGVESLSRVEVQSGEPHWLIDFPTSVFTSTMAPFFQVSDDNKTLYVFRSDPSGRPRQLVEIDLNSRRVKSVIHEFEEDGASLQLSPDGNTLAVVTAGDSKTSLARVDVTGDNYLELHPAPNPKAVQVSPQLAWTKDGLGILFALEEPVTHDLPAWGFRDADVLTRQRIWHVDADGATPATFTEVEVQFKRLQQISLNPDGSRLAIGLARGGRELWELDLSAVLAGPK